jgi:hypothetical protein
MREEGDKSPWLPGAATGLAVLSCYGTTLAIWLLSLLGISLAIDERAWAGVIAIFSVAAAIAIAASSRRHRAIGPASLAAIGVALILWAMFGAYDRGTEFLGFAFLVVAAVWDRRARSTSRGSAE